MIEFGFKDAIDILCVAFLLYYIYKLMKSSGSLNVFYGILIFIVSWILVSQVLQMKLLGNIFDKLVSVGVLALIILFQEDIRRFFLTIGTSNHVAALRRLLFKHKEHTPRVENPAIMQIVRACGYMSKNYVGALIIIERKMSLRDIVNSGETIDANINAQLIKNIFFKNSPLHDGAMVVAQNRIVAAACILPVSHSTNIPKELGLRHRAALGITQQSDALAIIVSEETGRITLAQRGEFTVGINQEELERVLTTVM
ncbi:MAG: diadenylate cyclase CdaA [Prevotellaceae bacterium]|nr:diadenylate cyclase CdaA [Prevotellaceae bacterium]